MSADYAGGGRVSITGCRGAGGVIGKWSLAQKRVMGVFAASLSQWSCGMARVAAEAHLRTPIFTREE